MIIGSFLAVMCCMFVGEWVSTKTHAYLPSIFVTAILFLIGYWTFLPKNLAANASYTNTAVNMFMSFILVHLGTMMSLKKLLQQWKAVLIAISGVLGTLLLTLTIGTLLFNWHTVIAAIPPLTGGIVAALLMTEGLKQKGIIALSALPIAMMVMHSLVGYPLTSLVLKQEGHRLLKTFSPKQKANIATDSEHAEQVQRVRLPKSYQTSAFLLAKVALVALLGNWLSQLMHGTINSSIWCLILGVIFHQIGFLEDEILNQAGVYNWLMYGILAYGFSQLSLIKPQEVLGLIVQIFTLIVLGLLGMFIISFILSKPLKMSWQMAFACSLTALFGFPMDYILTNEVVDSLTQDPQQHEYLLDQMLPKMLVGGFATVSLASVVIATIFLKLL